MYTEQQRALGIVQGLYGRSGFTHDFTDHRRVGCLVNGKRVMCWADTWDEAIEALKVKVGR